MSELMPAVRINWWHSYCQVSRHHGYTSTTLLKKDYCTTISGKIWLLTNFSVSTLSGWSNHKWKRLQQTNSWVSGSPKGLTLESLRVSLLFNSERKMKQIQFCIPPKPAFRLDRSARQALCFHWGGPRACNKNKRAGSMSAPSHTRQVWTSSK